MSNKGQKKKKLRFKPLLKLLIAILIFFGVLFYLLNLDIKNIYIKGNEQVKDVEIIEKAGIKDYPKIFRISAHKIKKDLKTW